MSDGRGTAKPVIRWTDFLLPLVCVLLVGANALYLSSADLDEIVQRAVKPSVLWGQTVDHIKISVLIATLVMLVAVPLGVLITRPGYKKAAPFVLALANVGQAAPSIGLLAIVGTFFIGLNSVVLVLAAYSVLPVLRNTIVGLEQVDVGIKDAARGQGMSPLGVLFKVELPLAIPVIGAGARTALVLAVATVAFGTYLGAGGLGPSIFGSIQLGRNQVLVIASLLIAVLALLLDWAGGLLQRALTPRGIR